MMWPYRSDLDEMFVILVKTEMEEAGFRMESIKNWSKEMNLK